MAHTLTNAQKKTDTSFTQLWFSHTPHPEEGKAFLFTISSWLLGTKKFGSSDGYLTLSRISFRTGESYQPNSVLFWGAPRDRVQLWGENA